jgi:hypothetical protein
VAAVAKTIASSGNDPDAPGRRGCLGSAAQSTVVGVRASDLPTILRLLFYRTVHTIIRQHPELLETQTLRFGASGLSVTNTVTSVQWPWERVHGVVDSTDFLMLRLDTIGSGAIVPKRALTKEQLESLLGYARSARRPEG